MNELNIFTDASITKTINGETVGCSGAIIEDSSIASYDINRDSTNNIAEITAVLLAVRIAIANKDKYDIINIWSDSQFTIFGLTKWIRAWVYNSVNHSLKNSSNETVKNQQLFLYIVKLILDNDIRINFYHIKGHVDTNNLNSVTHAITVFNRTNRAPISRERIIKAATMNNIVDNNTRMILSTFNKSSEYKSINRDSIITIITREDVEKYCKLVSLGGNKV